MTQLATVYFSPGGRNILSAYVSKTIVEALLLLGLLKISCRNAMKISKKFVFVFLFSYNACHRSAMSFFSRKSSESEIVDSVSHSESLPENTEHPLAEIIRFSLLAIIIVVPIRFFIAQPFIVSGASMEDTFYTGEYLIVDQLSYHFNQPARGDVIVFKYPKDPSKYFIKRIIGLPGETVTIENGVVNISTKDDPVGVELVEPYAKEIPPAPKLKETLGDREYFVMGDNRPESSDSRAWGVLQKERIIGRAWVRLFPPDVAEYLPGEAVPSVIQNPKQ